MQDKDTSPYTVEHAFGGDSLHQSSKIEDAVMVEDTVTFFGLNEPTAKTLKKMAIDQGLDGEPQEILMVREKGGKELLVKYTKALQFAADAVMRDPSFPVLKFRKDFSPGNYQVSEQLPINIMTGITANEGVAGTTIKFKENILTFLIRPGVSTLDYNKARRMIIDKANELLSVFDVEEIPTVSPNHDLKK